MASKAGVIAALALILADKGYHTHILELLVGTNLL